VTAAADEGDLRRGVYRIEAAEAQRVARRTIAASDVARHVIGQPRVVVDGTTVRVSLTVEAEHLFTGAMPGVPSATTITATASAAAVEP
jgi:precorrin-2 methylase